MKLQYAVEDWEETLHIPVEELVRRLASRFPKLHVDREKGNALVQERLDGLIAIGAPSVILESHRSQFGDTILATIADESWGSATATAILSSIRPPLGDGVAFETRDEDATTVERMSRDLANALGMIRCLSDDDCFSASVADTIAGESTGKDSVSDD